MVRIIRSIRQLTPTDPHKTKSNFSLQYVTLNFFFFLLTRMKYQMNYQATKQLAFGLEKSRPPIKQVKLEKSRTLKKLNK